MLRYVGLIVGFLGIFHVPCYGQEDGQIYRIKSKLSDKNLAPNEDGSLLVQATERLRDKKQRWRLIKSGQYFQIENVASGKVLTAPSKEAVAQITLEDNRAKDKPRPGQLWKFDKLKSRYTIQSRHSDLYLDVYDFGTEDGVKIVQQTLNEKPGKSGNQVWELVPVEK